MRILKSLFLLSFILFFYPIKCQPVLEKLDNGTPGVVISMFADTTQSKIYVGGWGWPTSYNPLYTWNGSVWDSLIDLPGSNIRRINSYDGKIYIGHEGGAEPGCPGITTYDTNGIWTDFAVTEENICGAIWDFCINNNELYAGGIFDSIAGIKASKIARYDGVNWYPFPVLDSVANWGITATAFYNGELYVGGNFVATCGPNMSDIARFDGTQWLPVGNGLTGPMTHVNQLYVYNGLLIVAGYFQKSSGDPGNNIVAWDGTNWIELGDGLMPSNVHDVIEYNGNLYACGQISYLPDSTPINRMAIWNGMQWSDAGLDFRISTGQPGTPGSFAKMNNELYIGGGFLTINGDTVNNIIKYKILTGTEEYTKANIKTFPNPTSDRLIIKGAINADIKLFSVSGQLVYKGHISSDEYSMDVNSFSKGMYILEISSADGRSCRKVIFE